MSHNDTVFHVRTARNLYLAPSRIRLDLIENVLINLRWKVAQKQLPQDLRQKKINTHVCLLN